MAACLVRSSVSTNYLSDRLELQNVAIIVWYWIGAFVWAFLYLIVNHSSILATAWQSQQNDVLTAKTQISLGIHPVWSESSLSAWRKLGSLATHWVDSEDWSEWADAQADLSLCWAHKSFCWFCDEAAHLFPSMSVYMLWQCFVFQASSYLELFSQLQELGFNGEKIKEALVKTNIDREQTLDILTATSW